MARAEITALLAGVSHLAIGTAYAASNVQPESQAHVFIGFVVLFCGVGVWKVVRRVLRGGASSFWTSTLGRWLIGRMAGTAVLGSLFGTGIYLSSYAMLPLLHAALWLNIPLSNSLIIGIVLAQPVCAGVIAWRLRTAVKVCIGKGSRPLRRLIRSMGMGSGGSSAFAGICEEWACRWRPGVFFLGHSLFDRHWPVGIKDDRMLSTIAGTGGGKSESSIVANLLLHPGSAFVFDVKGQLAAITAEARRKMGQTVHIIDPLNVLGQGTACIQPLSDLDPEALDYVERLRKIVDAMVMPSGERNRFFDEGARTVKAGGIDYLKRRKSPEFTPPIEKDGVEKVYIETGQAPTLADLYDLLTNPEFSDPEGEIINEMGPLGGPARSAAALMSQATGEALGGIMANALSNMNWLEGDAMRHAFSAADFSALDINNGKTTVYFVLPAELLGVHQRALRLVVNMFVSAVMQGRKVPGRALTLFIFDEAYAMGMFDLLTKVSAILRGFGARAWYIWQSKGQPDELYGKNAETFYANAGQVQVFAINDVGGANYISERIGKCARWRKRAVQTNQGMRTEWEPTASCSLRDGSEINRTTGREGRLQIVLNEGGDPFLLRRTSYWKMFKESEYAPDPFEPKHQTLARRMLLKLRMFMT